LPSASRVPAAAATSRRAQLFGETDGFPQRHPLARRMVGECPPIGRRCFAGSRTNSSGNSIISAQNKYSVPAVQKNTRRPLARIMSLPNIRRRLYLVVAPAITSKKLAGPLPALTASRTAQAGSAPCACALFSCCSRPSRS
jgi:hypothetical protein